MKKVTKYLLIVCIAMLYISPISAQIVMKDTLLTDERVNIAYNETTDEYFSQSPDIGSYEEVGDDWINRSYYKFDISEITSYSSVTIDSVKVLYETADVQSLTVEGDYTFLLTGAEIGSLNQPDYEDIWNAIGDADTLETDLDYSSSQQIFYSDSIKSYFSAHLSDNYLYIGAASLDEDITGSAANLFMKLIVTYERDNVELSLTARNDYHNSDGGNIGVGVDSNPTAYSSPKPFTGYEEQTLKLAAYDNQTIGGDLTVFNDTEAPTNESEWERSKGGSTQIFAEGNQTPSQTLSEDDDGATFAAILRGKYSITRNDYSPELGSNINTANVSVIEGNTLTAPATQTDNGIDYTFYEWSDGETDRSRTIDSPTSSLTARYKGSQISNNGSAFKANQPKVVRTSNGWEHMVPESMGHIWYEAKPSSGSWELVPRNNTPGSPLNLDTGGGTSPSIGRSIDDGLNGGDDFTVVAWQEGSQIKINRYYRYGGTGNVYQKFGSTLSLSTGQSSSYDLQPTVVWSGGRYFGIFYRSTSGIKYRFYKVDGSNGDSGTVPGTSGAKEFSVGHWVDEEFNIFALGFEKDASSPAGATQIRFTYIEYIILSGSENASHPFPYSFVVSSGSYPYNKIPSVTVTDSEMSVGWVSSSSSSWTPYNTKAAIAHVTSQSGSFNVTRSMLSNYVRSVSLNKLEDNSEYYAAWSSITYTDPSYPPEYFHRNYTAKGSALGTIKTLNTRGWDLQLTGATSENNMHAFSFYPQSTPKYWLRSNALGSYLKAKPVAAGQGRGVVVSDSSSGFSYAITDLLAGGEPIAFRPVEPERRVSISELQQNPPSPKFSQSLDDIRPFLVSQPFELTPGMELHFTEQVGVGDSLAARQRLGKQGFLSFKTRLVDASTGQVISTLRENHLTRQSVTSTREHAWAVETDQVKAGRVRLVMNVETNLAGLQAVAEDYYSDYQFLAKVAKEQPEGVLKADPEEKVTEYGLAQNYPNPFNPSTVISYQMPENSMVRLQVFDLLGRNVATLVNERQSTGRYSVNFDVSHLASGVYIYQLSAGGFVTSKKMFLIK